MEAPEKILVRATVHLPRLRLGQTALVDPSDEYVADCLLRGLVVPVPVEPERRAVAE